MVEVKARFPKGLRKAIERHRDRIEAKAGGWVDWENPLGCGSFGCVFPIWSKDIGFDQPGSQAVPLDQVLKISTDPTEGPVVSAIMKTGLDKILTGLARWYGVFRIPERIQEGPRGTAWVILRESVKPFDYLSDIGFPYGRGGAEWIDELRFYNKYAHQAIVAKTEWGKEKNWEQANDALAGLYNDQGTYYVAEAIEALRREDVILADVHHGNLGFRIHPTEEQPLEKVWWNAQREGPPLLIFDPGHSSAPEGTEVEDLFKLSGAANPWIEGEKGEIPEI